MKRENIAYLHGIDFVKHTWESKALVGVYLILLKIISGISLMP